MTTSPQAQVVALVALIINQKSNKKLCLEPSDTEKGGRDNAATLAQEK